jgi:Helix-hairpin-helix motif
MKSATTGLAGTVAGALRMETRTGSGSKFGFGVRRTQGRRPITGSRVLRIGDLGRRSSGSSRPATEAFGGREARAERADWQRRYGRAWMVGLESLARWSSQVGIPLRAGSRALASSRTALEWGWSWGWNGGGLPENTVKAHREERPPQSDPSLDPPAARPTWVLRTAPGWGERVREQIDRDGRLPALGPCPHLVVEESPLAFLPPEPLSALWPARESWLRAGRLLGVGGEESLLPSDLEDLVAQLREGALGRHPLEAERAWLLAWDLWCAASAWEQDRASWWMVRAAHGFVSAEEEAQWYARAADWGLRLHPATVASSRVCSRREGHGVRLGLDQLPLRVRDVASGLVLERERGGSFSTASEFVRRGRRCRVGWMEIADLAASGALRELPGVSSAFVAQFVRGLWPVVQRLRGARPRVGVGVA